MKTIRMSLKKIFLIALFFCAVFFISACSNKPYLIEGKKTIDDLSCMEMQLLEGEKEKNNISLSKWYYEDSNVAGFIGKGDSSVDLYTAYNTARTAKLLNDIECLDYLKTNLSFLKNTVVSEYTILNAIYYIYLCDLFEYEYDRAELIKLLDKYYDKDQSIFYLNSVSDSSSLKYALSSLCIEVCLDLISSHLSEMKNKMEETMDSAEFIKDNSMTFFSSGGGLIYYCNILGIKISINEKILSWFSYWKDIYESSTQSDVFFMALYNDFLEIALIIEPEYSAKRVNDYYNNICLDDFSSVEDIQYIFNSLKFVSVLNNNSINDLISETIKRIGINKLFTNKLSVRGTAFGIALSNFSGFKYNSNKVKTFLKEEYSKLSSYSDCYYKAEMLYYLVGIDQLVNGVSTHQYDDENVQDIINELLNSFNYGASTTSQDILSQRYVVETVSAIECLNGDAVITSKQAKKIKSSVIFCSNKEEIKGTIYFIFLRSIDRRLGLGIINNSDITGTINLLLTKNGFKSSKEELNSDIISTFEVLKCIEDDLLDIELDNMLCEIDYDKSQYCISNNVDDLNVVSLYFANYINNVNYNEQVSKDFNGGK